MNTFCLRVCVDEDWTSEDSLYVTIATVQAEKWNIEAKKFRKSQPEVMARFGNGRVAIIQLNNLLPELHR